MNLSLIFLAVVAAFTTKAHPAPLETRQAIGCAVIVNLCHFDVFYDNVPQQGVGHDDMGIIPAGGSYQVTYDSPQVGHSIKLGIPQNGMSDILQFEYSQTMDGHVDYDVSKVDGNPFGPWGFSLDSAGGCPTVRCESPVDGCTGIYEDPTSPVNPNYYCPLSADTGLTLCSG